MEHKEDKYEKTIGVYKKLSKKYIRNIKEFTPKEFPGFVKLLLKGSRVLDVGCAGGRDSKKFVRKGFRVIGIDLVDTFLREARKSVPNAKFIKMDLRKLKFPEDYFGAIWANAVLLHIKRRDIPMVLKGFYKVLQPGGKMHIRVKKGQRARYRKDELSKKEKRIFTYFSEEEFKRFIKKSGFRIITSRIFPDELGRKDVQWISFWAEK